MRTSTTRLSRTAAPAAALALLGLVAGCGGRTDVASGDDGGSGDSTSLTADPAPTASTPAGGTGGTAADPGGVFLNPPIGLPTAVPGVTVPPLAPNPTAQPRTVPYTGPVNTAGSRVDQLAAINATYDTFIANLSGLFRDLDPAWVTALGEVSTQQMTLAAARTAYAIQESKSHAVGNLRDARRQVTIKGNEAQVLSCLDEKRWYVIKDETLRPDPGITRGFFRGKATFLFDGKRWYVNTWNSLPQPCPAF